jgi:hypothetical protein
MLPLVHEHVDVIQLVPLWPVIWLLDSMIRLHRRPTWQRGVSAGAALGFTFWTSVHHALFVSVLLLLTVPFFPCGGVIDGRGRPLRLEWSCWLP